MALRDLLARFDVDTGAASQKLRQFDQGIGSLKASLGKLAGSIATAFAAKAVTGFIKEQIDVGDLLDKTSRKLGVSALELQKFQFAADLSGVSASQASVALGYLNKSVGDSIAGGKEQADTFRRLGVDVKDATGKVKPLSELVPELADGFAKMGSHQEKTAAAMKLLGRSGASLLPLFERGSKDLREMSTQFDDLGLAIDQDFIDQSAKAKDALGTLHRGFGALKSRLAIAILPTLTEWATKMQRGVGWLIKLTKETHIVKEAWIAMGLVAGVATAKAATNLARFTGLLPKGSTGMGAMLKQFAKLGLIVGLVLLLALLFEDLFVGIEGGQSVIRNWLNETLGVKETDKLFQQLKDTFDEIGQAFKDMGPGLKDLGRDLLKLATEVGPAVAKAFIFVVKIIASAISLLSGFGQVVAKIGGAVYKLSKGSNEGIDNLGSDLGKIIDKSGDRVFGKGGFFGASVPSDPAAAAVPYGPPRPGGGGKIEQRNDIKINVTGGTTNAETGRVVAGAVRGAIPQEDLNAALAGLDLGAD